MKVHRKELLTILGSRGHSIFAVLRRFNLGTEVMQETISANRYGKHKCLRSTIQFDIDECMTYFATKIADGISGPFPKNSKIVSDWKHILSDLTTVRNSIVVI